MGDVFWWGLLGSFKYCIYTVLYILYLFIFMQLMPSVDSVHETF